YEKGYHVFVRLPAIALALVIASCSTTLEQLPDTRDITDSDYSRLVDKFSVGDELYSGFYSVFQYRAPLLNSRVREAQLALKAKDFKWHRDIYLREQERSNESLSRESQIFLSFYTPVSENDNLSSNKTVWKIWLVVDQVRYEGVATKSPG